MNQRMLDHVAERGLERYGHEFNENDINNICKGIIYKATNIINNKNYIGQTILSLNRKSNIFVGE